MNRLALIVALVTPPAVFVVAGSSCAEGTSDTEIAANAGAGGSTSGTPSSSAANTTTTASGTTTASTTTGTAATTGGTTTGTATTTAGNTSSIASTSSGAGCSQIPCLMMCFSNPNAPCGQCVANQCECVPFDQCGLPSGAVSGVGGGFPVGGVGGGFPGLDGGFPSGAVSGAGGAGGIAP